MSASFEKLAEDALVLTPEERLELACRLLESVEPKVQPDTEAAWDEEIVARIKRYDADGEAIPAEQVIARLREMAPD